MRRLFSILLLAFFVLPVLAPLAALAADEDSGLPACCRRNGVHHCMSVKAQMSSPQPGAQFAAPPGKCPFCPAAVAVQYAGAMAAAPSHLLFTAPQSHPNGVAQTESRRRIARDRSRQKRGPPALSL